jgi:hypothetical protein
MIGVFSVMAGAGAFPAEKNRFRHLYERQTLI